MNRNAIVPQANAFKPAPLMACWGTTILAVAILSVLTIQRALSEGVPLPPYLDTDTYSRLLRVLDLWHGGAWYQPEYDRIVPDGLVSHWTRPLDALIILFALPLTAFLPDAAALHWAGYLVSPILCAITILVLTSALRPVMSTHEVAFTGLGLIFVLPVLAAFLPGRPDHYPPLLLVLSFSLWGLTRTMTDPSGRSGPIILGAALPLAIWVNISGVLLALGIPVLLGLRWLLSGPGWSVLNRRIALTALIVAVLALVLERPMPEDLWVVEFDRLSSAHITVFAVILGFWSVVVGIEQRRPAWSASPLRRLPWAGGLALAGIAALLALFPQLLNDDRGIPIDALYAQTRLVNIREYQPLIHPGDLETGQAALDMVIRTGTYSLPLVFGIAGLVFLMMTRRRPGHAWIWGGLLWLGSLYLATTWPPNAAWMTLILALMVPGYGAIAGGVFAALAGLRLGVRIPGRVGLVTLLLVGPAGVQMAARSGAEPRGEPMTERCHLTEVAQHLARVLPDQPRLNLMAFADMGPELMYWTPHNVYSIPNHRYQPGYTMTMAVLTADSPATAYDLLRSADVDVLILCAPGDGADSAPTNREAQPFRSDLIKGVVPPWLFALDLPPSLSKDALVFRFVGPDEAASRTGDGRTVPPISDP
jgi:hypothetical protein